MAEIPVAGLDQGREALRRFLVGEDDLTTMLASVARIATATVAGCDIASITLVRHGAPSTPVFTDSAGMRLDETQYRTGDGPCLATIRHHGIEHIRIDADDRWPEFRAAAIKLGVRATLAVPIKDDDVTLGALNLYSTSTDDFAEAAGTAAALLADQLGLAAANATIYTDAFALVTQLREAMDSRAVIEQAKGIIMAAERCGPEAAFDILRRASQNQNRKLRSIAAEIVGRYADGGNGDDHADDPSGSGGSGTDSYAG